MNRRVLLVEANHAFRVHLERLLEDEGYAVQATSGSVETSLGQAPDAVIIGLGDLGDQGLTIMDRIRQLAPGTPIIAMAHEGQFKLSLAARKHGAFDDILAPFDLRELLDKLEAASAQRNHGSIGTQGPA